MQTREKKKKQDSSRRGVSVYVEWKGERFHSGVNMKAPKLRFSVFSQRFFYWQSTNDQSNEKHGGILLERSLRNFI